MVNLAVNYTTIEQSRKLIELGVPPESSDCCIIDESDLNDEQFIKYSRIIFNNEFTKAQRLKWSREGKGYFPCWSVGRLIEIWIKCNEYGTNRGSECVTIGIADYKTGVIDEIFVLIKKAVDDKNIDFSKLNTK